MAGQYQSSGLGNLFRQVQDNMGFGMSDFSRYAPSNDDPAGFIALPVTTNAGVSVVIALQLSIDAFRLFS